MLKICYIFALPTRYPNEGQPISILEAMGNGMFIITTDHAGIPDVVDNNINGLVLNSQLLSVEQCFNNLLKKSQVELEVTIKENRKKVLTKYNQKTYIENIKKLFS